MVATHVARLGLAVAVGDLEPPRVAVRREHVGAKRLARGDRAPKGWHRAELGVRREHAVLGRRLTENGHALALAKRQALDRVERASQMSAAAPVSQGATKTLRADFDQPVAVVTQTRSSLPEPTQFSACPRCAGR